MVDLPKFGEKHIEQIELNSIILRERKNEKVNVLWFADSRNTNVANIFKCKKSFEFLL